MNIGVSFDKFDDPDDRSKSWDQVVEPPSSWRELPLSRGDFTADTRDISNCSYDSEDLSAGTWESDNDSVADIPDIEADEVFAMDTLSPDSMGLGGNNTAIDTNFDMKSKIGNLLERVNSRMRMRSQMNDLDKSMEIRADLETMTPIKKKVTFDLPSDNAREQTLTGYGVNYDYKNIHVGESDGSDDDLGDFVNHGADRLKATMQELNEKAINRMRATTPTVFGTLISRTQTPGPNMAMFDIKRKAEDELSDSLYESDSDEDRALNLAVFKRPSPIGSSTPDNIQMTGDTKGDRPNTAIVKDIQLDIDDNDKDDLELCFDSDEDRDIPTRTMSRWDEIRFEMDSGRRSARPVTSDFFDDDNDSDYEDDFQDNRSMSDDLDLNLHQPKEGHGNGSSTTDELTLSDEVTNGDKNITMVTDTNQSCAALETWRAEMQSRASVFMDSLKLHLEDEENDDAPKKKQSIGFVEEIRLGVHKSPEACLHEIHSPKDHDSTRMKEDQELAQNMRPCDGKATNEHCTKSRKTKGNKKNNGKRKRKKKATNPLLNTFPGNSYVIFDRPVLPPIRGQGGESWRSNSPQETQAWQEEKKTPVIDDSSLDSSSTKKTGDALILEKSIAKINRCNKDLDQRFVPMETDVFDAPANPALKQLETHSLRVAKFRAEFNKDTTLLPAQGKVKEDNKIIKFMKQLKGKLVNNPGLDIIDRAEKRRQEELDEYRAKLREVQESAQKSIDQQSHNFMAEPMLPIGHKYGYKECDTSEYSCKVGGGYDVYDNGHDGTKLLKRQPGFINIGNDGQFDQYGDNTLLFQVKGWEIDENGKIWPTHKNQNCTNDATWRPKTQHPGQYQQGENRNSKYCEKEVQNTQGKIKIHNNIAMDNALCDKPEINHFHTCVRQPLIASERMNQNHRSPVVPPRGAMKAVIPFTMDKQEHVTITSIPNNGECKVESANLAESRVMSTRLMQASGLQREAVHVQPPRPPSAGKPSTSRVMRSRFQRLFNKMVNGNGV